MCVVQKQENKNLLVNLHKDGLHVSSGIGSLVINVGYFLPSPCFTYLQTSRELRCSSYAWLSSSFPPSSLPLFFAVVIGCVGQNVFVE